MAIFLILENTLFDLKHAVRCALTAIQATFYGHIRWTLDALVSMHYATILVVSYRHRKSRNQMEQVLKEYIETLFWFAGQEPPTGADIKQFQEVYGRAYRLSKKATPGTIETLHRLRDSGYTVVIITSARPQDALRTTDAIGVSHLVDAIITFTGLRFRRQASIYGASTHTTPWGAENMDCDLQHSLLIGDAPGLTTAMANASKRPRLVLYDPKTLKSEGLILGETVPAIQHMSQLSKTLDLALPRIPRIQLQL